MLKTSIFLFLTISQLDTLNFCSITNVNRVVLCIDKISNFKFLNLHFILMLAIVTKKEIKMKKKMLTKKLNSKLWQVRILF